ncbi:MAG: hypothetical protein M1457_06565, partial [bacterium]|nr:hypothetical protein [bacterium]
MSQQRNQVRWLNHILILGALGLMPLLVARAAGAAEGGRPAPALGTAGVTYPILIGADGAGRYFTKQKLVYWQQEAWYRALDDYGIKYVDVHISPITDHGSENSARMAETFLDLDRRMRDHGKVYTINVEHP